MKKSKKHRKTCNESNDDDDADVYRSVVTLSGATPSPRSLKLVGPRSKRSQQ